MTDVGANVALHSNQIDFSLYATVAVIVPLVLHSNVSFEPWVASAAALGCSHLCLFIVRARWHVRLSVDLSVQCKCVGYLNETTIGRKKPNLASSPECCSLIQGKRVKNRGKERKERKEKEILKEKCGNVCACEKAKESKKIHDYRLWEQNQYINLYTNSNKICTILREIGNNKKEKKKKHAHHDLVKKWVNDVYVCVYTSAVRRMCYRRKAAWSNKMLPRLLFTNRVKGRGERKTVKQC